MQSNMNAARALADLSAQIGPCDLSKIVFNYYYKTYKAGWAMQKPHKHAAVEFSYIIDGFAYVWLENQVFKVCKNDVFSFSTDSMHRLYIDEDKNCTIINLQLNMTNLNLSNSSFLSDLESQLQFLPDKYMKISDKWGLGENLKRIILELNGAHTNQEALAKLEICSLFLRMSSCIHDVKLWSNDAHHCYISKTKQYINDSLAEKLAPQTIADNLHISKDYLMHLFKSKTGKTIMQYIMERRIDMGKTLLSTSTMSISDIALASGFSSLQHFSALFRKNMDMTPSKFRKLSNEVDNLLQSEE